MAFDVASVKQNKSSDPPNSNVALGPGDYYNPTRGLFLATNLPAYTYTLFAYKATANQTRGLSTQVPKWVLLDRFDTVRKLDDLRPAIRSVQPRSHRVRDKGKGRWGALVSGCLLLFLWIGQGISL
jgi:hypothetical protein